ncbi:head maturation protease [Vibrio phage K406]
MSKDAPKMAIRTKSDTLSTKYTVMFDSDIEESSEYHEHFYVMEQAGKDDLVEVCISSLGGSVATISKFQDVVKNSEAHFHAKLHGYGYSAGGALFLLCDTQEVSDLATFMAHSVQTGYSGGSQAIEAHSKMTTKQNRVLCEMLYQDFLSPEEIDRICDGAEIWMEAEEIRERLAKRKEVRNQQAIEEAKETYTPEVYATQCVLDITEDCESFGYDPVEIIKEMLEQAFEAQEAEVANVEEFPANVSGLEGEPEPEVRQERQGLKSHTMHVVFDGEIFTIGDTEINILSTYSAPELKLVADTMGIPFAYNIGIEKLRQRILDFLNEED